MTGLLLTGAGVGGKATAAAGSFPAVEGTATYNGNSASTTHNVSLPASIASGDILVICMVNVGSSAITTPSGWTSEASRVDTSPSGISCAVFSKVATGSEGATVAVTTPNGRAAATSYRISGANSVEASSISDDTNDPPSLAPTWGSAKTLWITGWFSLASDWTMSAAPTNYSNLLTSKSSSSSAASRCGLASAERENEASSEDPGAWSPTGGSPTNQGAVTIAVEPS